MANSITSKEYWENNFGKTDFFKFDDSSYKKYYNQFLKPDSKKKVIEIGAFPGANLGYLAKKFGYHPTALDFLDRTSFIKENMVFNGIKNCKIIKEDFLKWEPQEKYDLVISHGFIEHFSDYKKIIKKHIDILNNNGVLIISVPYLGYYQYWIRKLLYRKEVLKRILRSHNRRIMNLEELKKVIFSDKRVKKLFAGFIREMTTWFSSNDTTIRKNMSPIYATTKKIESVVNKFGLSNRIISPEILIVAQKKNEIQSLHFPNYIRIEVTNHCNLRCKMCFQSTYDHYQGKKLPRGFIKKELFYKITDELSRYEQIKETPFYLHIGGEPLLHQNIVDFITHSAGKGLKPILTTNGTLLTPGIAKKIIAAGLYKIEFSFEGMSKEIYEKFRRGSDFEIVKNNIDQFLKLNKAQGSPVKTELVVVNLPQVPDNIKTDFVKKMKHKFDRVNLSGYFDWLGKVDKKVAHEKNKKNYTVCSAVETDLNVLHDGTVIPCCMDVYGEMPIGDFNKMSLEEVLNSSDRKELKEKLINIDIKNLPCKNCVVSWGSRK